MKKYPECMLKTVPLPYFEIAGQAVWFDQYAKANTVG
jgi:hypothetical protein